MKYYGIQLATGTVLQDLTCEGGTSYPSTNLMKGRMFYRTDLGELCVYDGITWEHVVTAAGGIVVTSVNGRNGAVVIQTSDLVNILPVATTSTLGAIKVGDGLSVDGSGMLSISQVIIPSGSKLLWAQPSAPTGWTQVASTETDGRMLRVVSAAGGSTGSGGTGGYGYGGTDNPTTMSVVPSHTHSFVGSPLGQHSHTDSGHTHSGVMNYPSSGIEQNQKGGADGPWSGVGSTAVGYANFSAADAGTPTGTISANAGAGNWAPKYLNLILCSKN